MNTHRIGILGLTHDHVWSVLEQFRATPSARLIGAADPHQRLLGRIEREFHCRPYTGYETLLNSEQLDAVLIYADNAAGVELAEMAAARKLHVLLEKPMAATGPGAKRIWKVAQEAGIRLLVNWPFAWWPQLQQALRMIRAGRIGRIWQVRYRAAHAGPQELGCSPEFCEWLMDPAKSGPGGAFVDYCCYGALLARVVMGMPTRATVAAGRLVKESIPVEDNAILLMHYPDGLAIAEGSWTQIGELSAYTASIYGTEGTLLIEPPPSGQLWLADRDHPRGSRVPVSEAEANLSNVAQHFLHVIDSGADPIEFCSAEASRDAQQILDEAWRNRLPLPGQLDS